MTKKVYLETLKKCAGSVHFPLLVLSKPIIRHNDGKANRMIRNVNKHLSALQSDCIENDNISSQYLGRKGLHLNRKGKGRLVLNFMKQIRNFEGQ